MTSRSHDVPALSSFQELNAKKPPKTVHNKSRGGGEGRKGANVAMVGAVNAPIWLVERNAAMLKATTWAATRWKAGVNKKNVFLVHGNIECSDSTLLTTPCAQRDDAIRRDLLHAARNHAMYLLRGSPPG